jgi:hypothetical protein
MNLPYAHKLLIAVDGQRHGFMKLRGSQADHEERLMSAAGLDDSSFDDGRDGSFTSINRLTAAGQTFLRAFRDQPIPDLAALGESIGISPIGVVTKWKAKFHSALPRRAVA